MRALTLCCLALSPTQSRWSSASNLRKDVLPMSLQRRIWRARSCSECCVRALRCVKSKVVNISSGASVCNSTHCLGASPTHCRLLNWLKLAHSLTYSLTHSLTYSSLRTCSLAFLSAVQQDCRGYWSDRCHVQVHSGGFLTATSHARNYVVLLSISRLTCGHGRCLLQVVGNFICDSKRFVLEVCDTAR